MGERENQSESYSMELSVCEIYNNDVRDLLSNKATRVRLIISNTMTLGKLVIKCPRKPREGLWKSQGR